MIADRTKDGGRTIVITWLQSSLDAFCRPLHEPRAVVWTHNGDEEALQDAINHAHEHVGNCHPLVFFSDAADPIAEAKARMARAYGFDDWR